VARLWKRRINRGQGMGNRKRAENYESHKHGPMPYRVLKPVSVEEGKQYPLIVSLHGAGGVGDDNLSNLRYWNGIMTLPKWRELYPCYVLVPQAIPGSNWGPKPAMAALADVYVKDMLPLVFEVVEQLREEHPIDGNRIYALGASMGGSGTWNILAAKPEMFAAAIPVCAGQFPEHYAEKLTGIPLWIFHGYADNTISVDRSRDAFAALKKAGANVKYTEMRGVGHAAWVPAFRYVGDDRIRGYETSYSGEECDRTDQVWDWLFAQHK
jgi:predicted peptidase